MSPLPAVARARSPFSKNRYVERRRLVHPHNPPRARPAFLLYAPRAARAADALPPPPPGAWDCDLYALTTVTKGRARGGRG